MKQTCVLVPGMHRSGTSAFTGVLQILGVYLGESLIEPMSSNEKGHFENRVLYRINEDILAGRGNSWDDVFFCAPNEVSPDELAALTSALAVEFKGKELFAIKDPRLALLFPLYEAALTALGVDIKILIPYRDPYEVAASLRARNGYSINKGLVLWGIYFFRAVKASRGLPRCFVGFDQLLSDRRKAVEMIEYHLNLGLLSRFDKDAVDGFVASDLKHQERADATRSDDAPDYVERVCALAQNLNDRNSQEVIDKLGDDFFAEQRLFYHEEVRFMKNSVAELSGALKDARVEQRRLLNESTDLSTRLNEARANVTRLMDLTKKLENDLFERDRALQSLRRHHQDLRGKWKTAERERALLERRNEFAQNECARMRASASWKLTRPLRLITRALT